MEKLTIHTELEKRIFEADEDNFADLALSIFKFQYSYNQLYKQYCDALRVQPYALQRYTQIPFLPIQFFKTHGVTTTEFEPKAVFESSATTGNVPGKHYVKSMNLYKKSFIETFEEFYGYIDNYCIIGLLPSYLERGNSSLVKMVNTLIQCSGHELSGFYLDDYEKLHNVLLHNEIKEKKTIVIGVTYALLDFAEKYPMSLHRTIIMETGGMKGRRKELTRAEVHEILKKQLSISVVHSEYGMTELLSQAYAIENGIFKCPAWMRVLLRDEDDPLTIHKYKDAVNLPITGAINVIDFCNLYSCSFIATDDVGKLYPDGSFEILGRLDASDVRGCSLMSV